MIGEPERTAVYHIRGEEGVLIYIGLTNGMQVRWNGHERVQPWWGEVRSITLEWYPSRDEAADAEKAAILAEQPKYNVTYLKPLRGKGGQAIKPPIPVQHGLAVIKPRDDDEDLVDEDDVAGMLRSTVTTTRSLFRRANGPSGFMLGKRQLWRRGEIRQWIADIEASHKAPAARSPEPRPEPAVKPRPRRRLSTPRSDAPLFAVEDIA